MTAFPLSRSPVRLSAQDFLPPIEPRFLAFSACSYVAAMAAMYVSMSIGLPRPWWVLMTAYVTIQPMSGPMQPKMLHRLGGVLLGAIVATVLTPALVNTPLQLSLVLAIWIGACIYFAVLDRTPRAFVFTLAAYTAAIIGFPYVDNPGNIFAIALARLEEMGLAIVFVTVLHRVLLPMNITRVLERRVSTFLSNTASWIADAFRGLQGFREDRKRGRLAADISELDILAFHLPPSAPQPAPTQSLVRALQGRLSLLIPLASATADRLDALRARKALPAAVADLVDDVVAWLLAARPAASRGAETLQARCRALIGQCAESPATWDTLLVGSLCQRLGEFIAAYQQAQDLAQHLRGSGAELDGLEGALVRHTEPSRRHRQQCLAVPSGLSATVSVMIFCLFWIATAWPDAMAAAPFTAIVACSFAAQDDPAPGIMRYLAYTAAAIPVSLLYLFVILPKIDGFPMLFVAMAPALLLMGYIQADPARSSRALPMLSCFILQMGFTARYNGDFAHLFNTSLAQIGGIVVSIGTVRVLRSVDAAWTARRILRSAWRDLAAMAESQEPVDELIWTERMVDRIALVSPRLALAERPALARTTDALKDLRIGLNVAHLQSARVAAPPEVAGQLNEVLSEVAALFTRRAASLIPVRPPASLLAAVDTALSALGVMEPGELRWQAQVALTGMRRNLFPRAHPYVSTHTS